MNSNRKTDWRKTLKTKSSFQLLQGTLMPDLKCFADQGEKGNWIHISLDQRKGYIVIFFFREDLAFLGAKLGKKFLLRYLVERQNEHYLDNRLGSSQNFFLKEIHMTYSNNDFW